MPRTSLSSPIAAVVDQAHRRAVALSAESSSKGNSRDGFGEGFVRTFFVSADALTEALQPELLNLLHEPAIESLLPEDVKAQIRAEFLLRARDLARLVVSRLSDPYQTGLQGAILKFLKARPGTSFCFQSSSDQAVSVVRPGRILPRPHSRYPGRDNEVHGIVQALLDTTQGMPSIVLGGPGGIGKTTLALMVLDEVAVRNRYGERRFWISCETAYSAEHFLDSIITTLSSTSTLSNLFALPLDDVDLGFLGLLDRIGGGSKPAIVAFDNLETTFEIEAKLVERVLSVLLTRCAILVTIRGQRRPYIGGPWSWPLSSDNAVQRLPETAWRLALKTHAGFELQEPDYATIEPVLRRVDGYPLALSLLGCRLARGEYSAQSLKRAWDKEISRGENPDDTRQTSISTSIRVSLAAPSVTNTPLATDSLILAAHLPPSFYPPASLHKNSPLLNGLPKWLGQALCGGEGERDDAWAALNRCGLAYTDRDAPDHLQLLPPIQDTVRSHESVVRISKSNRDRLVDALERAYLTECRGTYAPINPVDQGEFGKEAKASLLICGTLAPSTPQPHHDLRPETLAETAYLLGLICRNAGYLISGAALFRDADDRHTSLGYEEAAITARAYEKRLGGELAHYQDRPADAIVQQEEEGGLWDLVKRPRDTAYARASVLYARARIARLDGRLEEAAQHKTEEALQWESSGRSEDAASARASALDYRSQLAYRGNRFEEAALLHDEEALMREQADEPSAALMAKANALGCRSDIAERQHQLEDAARGRDEEAALWEQAQQLQDAAHTRAQACSLRARLAEQEGRLDHAVVHRNEEASWLDEAGFERTAVEARHQAEQLREQISRLEDRSEDDAERVDELTPLLESRPLSALSAAAAPSTSETPALGDGESEGEGEGEGRRSSKMLWGLCRRWFCCA